MCIKPERLPNINEPMEKAVKARYFEVLGDKVLEDEGYIKAINKFDDVIKKITSLLPEEKDLRNELVITFAQPEEIKAEIMYRQGLIDGMALAKAWEER